MRKTLPQIVATFSMIIFFSVSGWGAAAPVMNPDTMSVTIPQSIANNSEIMDVNATDRDQDTLTYSITGGNSSGAFQINSSSGMITVFDNTKLIPTTHILNVEVRDGTSTGNGPRKDTGTVTVTVTAVSNTPDVSISATIKSISVGTADPDLLVKLNQAGNTDDINITYEHNCTGSLITKYLTIEQGETSEELDVDTSGLTAGDTCKVTLKDAQGIGSQEVNPVISPDTSIITVLGSSPDLNITKTASVSSLEIDKTVLYTITVGNDGTATANNIVMTDILPFAVTVNSISAGTGWTCTSISIDPIVCNLSTLAINASTSIDINITVPADNGIITNEANVSCDDEINLNNNFTSVDVYVYDIENPSDLCYVNSTGTGGNNKCSKAGSFYYSNGGCVASVQVVNVSTSKGDVDDIIISKLYDPSAVGSTCSSSQGNCTGLANSTLTTDYPDYTKAYTYDVGTLSYENNVTITDTNTEADGTGNAVIDDILLYASYTIDDIVLSGRIATCANSSGTLSDYAANVDVVDDYSINPYDPWIRTKVSKQTGYSMKAVYLGGYTDANPGPQPYYPGGGNNAAELTILYKLADMSNEDTTDLDAACNSAPSVNLYESIGSNTPVISYITTDNTVGITENPFQMAYVDAGTPYVKQDLRIKYKAVDFNQLFDDAGIQCVKRSSRNGNVKGIPQCLITNSPNTSEPGRRYRAVFGDEAFNRCYDDNGKPCYASNGGVGTDPYDHEYGCFECSLGTFPYQCSKDEFALRPERFDANITHIDAPHLLRSGKDYNTTLIARDADDAISTTYTVLDFDSIVATPTPKKYFNNPTPPWQEDIGGLLLNGDTSVTAVNPSHMVNGVSRLNTTAGGAEEIVGVTFDDVGRVGMYVADINWSQVDNDDTPMDCNSSEHTYICADLNVTFIPHHFAFEELNITNHAGPDSNFTYVANSRGMPTSTPPTRSPMAARIHTRIEALNQNNLITQNFREDFGGNFYYENNISVTQNVVIPTTAYLYGDEANASNIDDKKVGFGRTSGTIDAPGTRNITWDESTYPLEFNFRREINEVANPFDVNGTYFSISLVSDYTQNVTRLVQDPLVEGSRIGDSNTSTCVAPPAGSCIQSNAMNDATFYYARTRSSKFFYDDNIHPGPVTTPIFIDVYCDLGFTACDAFGINTVSGQISDADWWLSWNHSRSRGDGTITLSPSANGSISPTQPNINNSGGADKLVAVTHTATTLPDIVDIDFVTDDTLANFSNAWLIYNADNPWTPTPFYRVRFIGTPGWAGHGDTGHVVGGASNIQKNRRLEW